MKVARRDGLTKSSLYWLPADAPDDAPLPPSSGRDALRKVTQAASAQLGRLLSRAEIDWWRDGHTETDPVAIAGLGAAQFGRVVDEAQRQAPRRRMHEEDVRLITTSLTCRGGSAPRFAVGSISPADHDACRLVDAMAALRPKAELDGVHDLESMLGIWDSEIVEEAVATRRALLPAAFTVLAGPVSPERVERRGRELVTLQGWVSSASTLPDFTRHYRERQLEAHLQNLDAVTSFALETLLVHADVEHPSTPARVGAAAGVDIAALEPIGLATAFLVGMKTPAHWRNLLLTARRFPDNDPQRLAERGGLPGALPTLVDRVDGLLGFHDAVGDGETSALLSSARLLLGHVLRDADVLTDWLARTEARDGHTRRALVVALGLLGVAPDLTAAIPDERASDDWAAYILALSLVELEQPRLVGRLADLAPTSSRTGARLLDEALRKAESGLVLSLLG